MDLNYLFQRHQISLHLADHASCAEARDAHRGLAEGYQLLIERRRNGNPNRLLCV